MKLVSYLILLILLVICLLWTKNETFDDIVIVPGKPEIKSIKHTAPQSIEIIWSKPVEIPNNPITGYIIMLKKSDNSSNGIYINFDVNVNCVQDCKYTITNVPLIADTYYTVGVMAVNKNGAGIPTEREVKTKTTATITNPSPTSTSTPTPTSKSDLAKLDPYLENMIARADGVFAYNKDTLEYPDNYQTDIKQLLNTFNDDLKA